MLGAKGNNVEVVRTLLDHGCDALVADNVSSNENHF
jgi:hypothetical protein